MPLSAKKKSKIEMTKVREEREAYIRSCAIRNNMNSPFGDANWDEAARKYLETGDEKLKTQFPLPRTRGVK